MGENSKIEWTDASWTPIRARNKASGKIGWHCEHVSEGCRNCYAEGLNRRLGTGLDFKPGHRSNIELLLDEQVLLAPLRWQRPRMVFVCSMTDLFADFVSDEWIDRMFAVMALSPQHTFQVLTKRSARMRAYMTARPQAIWDRRALALDPRALDKLKLLPWPLPNVWLGVSCEDQQHADARVPDLLATPAAVRFVSAEPLLGPVDFCGKCTLTTDPSAAGGVIDWIIVGGESGSKARPMSIQWAREIRDQCAAAGIPFFMKQMTKKAPIPDDLFVREMPRAAR